MTISSFVTRMRVRQADLFDTTIHVTRDEALGAFDPDSASYAPRITTVIYDGPALIRPAPASIRDLVVGDTAEQTDQFSVKVPVDTDLAIGDNIDVTASTYDAGLTGKTLRLLQINYDEWQVCRRGIATDETGRPA